MNYPKWKRDLFRMRTRDLAARGGIDGPDDVHRYGTIVCPSCVAFGRDQCAEHRATSAAAIREIVETAPASDEEAR